MRTFQNWMNAHQNILTLFVVCSVVLMVYTLSKWKQKLSFGGLIVYTFFVLYKTVFSRKRGFYLVDLDLGWSYKAMLNGVPGMFSQIYLNIMFFIPIGIFSEGFLSKKCKRSYILSIAYGVMLTVIVECLQLFFHCGTFELDDILNNTIGTIIGILIVLRINMRRGENNGRS